jgi:uroporphyrinogen decarboxylase
MTQELSPRQRSVATMFGRLPDRVPCVPLIDNSYSAAVLKVPVSECFIHPETHAESLVACFDKHPHIGGVSINLGLAEEIILEREETSDDYFIKTTGGITWMIPHNDVGSVMDHEITDFDDPRLEVEDPLKPGIVETLRCIPDEIRERYLINAGVTGPFSQIVFLMGLERVMTATIEDPAGLHRAIEKRVPFAIRWVQEMAELNAGSIWIGEGPASSSLISPATYREFVQPYQKAVVDEIREANTPSVIHMCGKLVDPALDAVAETGVNCLELDWPVDAVNAKQRIGDRVCLKGNLNTTLLVQLQADQVYEMAGTLIDEVAAGGRFILSSGCALGRDTPPENVDAMAQAALDHGWYETERGS